MSWHAPRAPSAAVLRWCTGRLRHPHNLAAADELRHPGGHVGRAALALDALPHERPHLGERRPAPVGGELVQVLLVVQAQLLLGRHAQGTEAGLHVRVAPRVVAVGRLDLNSEGLLLLTNDGGLARRLELPSSRWRRRYRVRAHGKLSPPALAELAGGATVDGVRYAPIAVRVDREGRNSWLTVDLHEGRNREIRKVLESIGLAVNRLIRVSYGSFRLASLAPGEVREVPRKTLPARLSEHADHRR